MIATIEYTVAGLLALAWIWIAVDIAAEKFSEMKRGRCDKREADELQARIEYWQKYDREFSQQQRRITDRK